MRENIITDLAEFGYREQTVAAELLRSVADKGGLSFFNFEGPIRLFLNKTAGFVFLSGEEGGDCIAYDEDKKTARIWFSCGTCGREGFSDDLLNGDDCCVAYLRDTGHLRVTKEAA